MKPSETITQVEASSQGLPPLTGWRKTFAALHTPNYRYFFMGQGVSLIGTWARSTALGWMAYAITKSELMLGAVSFLNSLPFFIFAIYSGSLADRFPKLRIFTLTSCFAMTCSLILALLLFHAPVGIGVLLIFAPLWGLAVAFEMPARQSLMVELVGKKDLVNAIALNSAMVNSSRVIGPAIGSNLYAIFGPAWCFLMDALSFLAVLFGIYKIKLPSAPEPKTPRGGLKYILEGFAHLKTNPMMAQTIFLLLILGMGGWAYQSQLPAFVSKQLGMGVTYNGFLMSMNGLGACTAALVVAHWGHKLVKIKTLYVGIAIYSLAIVLFGFLHNPIGAALVIFFAGFGIILFFSIGNSYLQTHSPDHLRGRIMGIWALVFGGGMPIGSLWMGVVASHTGSGMALQIGGVFCALGALIIYWFFSKSIPARSTQ